MATSSFYQSSGSSPAAENTIAEQVNVAQTAATTASTASTSATNSATSAASSFTSFQTFYLGAFAVAPPTSQLGALYFDSASSQLKIWTGSAWEITASSTSISTTDDIAEGSSNLYYSNERVDDRVNGLLVAGSNITLTYDDAADTLTIASTASGSGGSSNFISLTDTPANYTGSADKLLRVNNYGTGVEFFDITAADLNMQGNKVLFGNMYSAESDLPSASTYHGMFAHVHGTGKGYFAHAGSWHKLLDETSSTTTDLTEGSNLYYTNERVDDRVNALLTAGSNITLTYNDTANTLTIASTASGGSGGEAYVDIQTTSGTQPSASGTDGIAIGKQAVVGSSASNSIAIGSSATANNSSSIAIGLNSSTSSYSGSIALGSSAVANAHNQLMLGAASGYVGALTSVRVANSNYTPSNAMDLATKSYVDSNSGGSGGSSTFTGLTDTPSSFTASKFVAVNSGGTALEYATALTPSNLTVTNNAASGGGSVSYIPSANGATLQFIPPDLSSYIDLTDISVTTASASGGGNLAYDNTTGVFTFTPASLSGSGGIGLTDLSASNATASGGGSLAYNNTTGAFTFTPPDFSGYATTSSLSSYATTASLATVATSGAYGDLSGTPNLSGYLTGITGESLYSLSNVYTSSSPSDGQVLTWDNANSYWKPTTVSAGSSGIALTDLSVTTATGSGNGGLNYNNSTGVFTFTPADVNSAKPWLATTSTSTATTNSQSESLALGAGATVQTSTGQAIAIGHGAVVSGARGVAIGKGVEADVDSTIIGGRSAFSGHVGYGNDNTIVGSLHAVKGTNQSGTTLIGSNTTGKDYSTAIGYLAQADHDYSVAIGFDAETTAANQLMLGDPSNTDGFTSIQVGNTSYSPSNAMDLTTKSYVDTNTIGLTDLSVTNATASGSGSLAYNSGTGVFTFTPAASSGGGSAPAWLAASDTGSASATATTSLAIGDGSVASALRSLAVGYGADSTAQYTSSFGHFAEALAESSTALGYDTNVSSTHSNSIALGRGATTSAARQLMLGIANTSTGLTSIRVGNTSYTPTNNMDLATKAYVDANAGGSLPSNIAVYGTGTASATSTGTIAIGDSALVGGNTYGIAIGSSAQALDTGAIAIGQSTSVNGGSYGISIGYSSVSTGLNGPVAIGYLSYAGAYSTAVGNGYNTNAGNRCWSGYTGVSMGYQASGQASYATALGGFSGVTSAGLNGTAVGYGSAVAGSNGTALGNGALAYANQFVLGNSSINDLRCQDTYITGI